MKKVFFALILSLLVCSVNLIHAQNKQELNKLLKNAEASLTKGIKYFHSIAIEGGYVYYYTVDLKEKWGEGKTDDFTVEVQPPGTPAVGMSYLQAYKLTKNPAYLKAAEDAGDALIQGQNELGGWEHVIHFNQPTGEKVSFDDDQTQMAISFLMALDQEMDKPELSKAVEKALDMMLASQLKNGGWPHRYPEQGNYHDFATFNDEGINDCIRVMLEAHGYYGKDAYKKSLDKVGRFLMISQLPPPQPGWAQQYNEYLQPAWARTFEPPSVCPSASLNNIQSLIDIYLHTGKKTYLEPIPDALRWLNESRLSNGKWGRFLEIGTNKPLYYDRGRIRVDSLHHLSLERRTGYGYETDFSEKLSKVTALFKQVNQINYNELGKFANKKSDSTEVANSIHSLIPKVKEIIDSQDEKGRWITKNDSFKKREKGEHWKGEYRVEDRISSAVFNQNVEILCDFIRLVKEEYNWRRLIRD